jgi:hypothetical protein
VVVVAGHEHDPPAGERTAQRLERRTRHLERLRERALAQLERVAQHHQAVHAGDRLDQRLERLSAARDVGIRQAADVEVRYDGRAHPGHGVRWALRL